MSKQEWEETRKLEKEIEEKHQELKALREKQNFYLCKNPDVPRNTSSLQRYREFQKLQEEEDRYHNEKLMSFLEFEKQ